MLLLGLGGCGGGGAAVEASFAPGTEVDAVSVAESGRTESADTAGFALEGLSPGPARIRLVRGGETVGILQIAVPAGARLRLLGLAVDPASGLAFPRSVDLDGAETLSLNGLRFAPEGRVPRRPELGGEVLAWSHEAGALLLRPEDERLPDLRVVVLPDTDVVGTDGGGADVRSIAAGDPVRLEGRREGGYVVAERLVLPTRIADPTPPPARPLDDDRGNDDGGNDEEGEVGASRPAAAPAAAPARPAAERERERGRSEERGRGKGKGPKKERGRG